jgi:hypothetical protein
LQQKSPGQQQHAHRLLHALLLLLLVVETATTQHLQRAL